MRSTLRANPALRRLIAAWAQSSVGTGAGYVALLLLAYQHLRSPWAISLVLIADFAPAIAFGAWFGALADRYSRRRLVVAGNLIQAAAFSGLAVAQSAPLIVALALTAGTGNAMLRPALRAALPTVAAGSTQVGVALFETCRYVGITVGPAVAAGLFAISSGVTLPLALNALSFVVAAGMLSTLSLDQAPDNNGVQSRTGLDLRKGLATALRVPAIAVIIGCSAGIVLAGGLLNVSEPILATRALNGTGADYALLVAIYGLGMVVAALLTARRGRTAEHSLIRRYLLALVLESVGMGASAAAAGIPGAALAFGATGFANALLVVSQTQLVQIRVPQRVQGRLFGFKDALEGACFLAALLAAGALIELLGVRVTLAIASGVCAICAVVARIALRGEASEGQAQKVDERSYAASGSSASDSATEGTIVVAAVASGAQTTSTTA
jgi:MFS family permease